ncbi:hypothetical protein GW17_00061825, partial [Ensete ventricosum]
MVKVDFSGHLSLAEKKSADMVGMARRGGLARAGTTEEMGHKLSLDNEREIGRDCSSCRLRGRTLQKGGARRTPRNQQGKE